MYITTSTWTTTTIMILDELNLLEFFLCLPSGTPSPSQNCATSCGSWTRRRTSSGRRWSADMKRTATDCRRRCGSTERPLKERGPADPWWTGGPGRRHSCILLPSLWGSKPFWLRGVGGRVDGRTDWHGDEGMTLSGWRREKERKEVWTKGWMEQFLLSGGDSAALVCSQPKIHSAVPKSSVHSPLLHPNLCNIQPLPPQFALPPL